VGFNPTRIFFSCQDAGNHNGGNIHFGPDGMLYITIGENAQPANSQNPGAKQGKIHRVTPDGSLPTVIPNPTITSTGQISSVFAMGLRNSFDFDFDPLTPLNPWPRIFASENGPGCDDEMNRIEGGYNYGWRPSYPCDDISGPNPAYNTIPPMWFLTTGQCCEAPTGAHVYRGWAVPQWQNDLFMCAYSTGALRHFYLDPTRTYAITVATVQGVTCNMDIETGPDGAFYYMQGGGYSIGTLYKITVPGVVSPTPTAIQPTATNTPVLPTATATDTAQPATPSATTPPATASATEPVSTPSATATGTHVMPSPTATEPGGATGTPTTPPTPTATNTAVNFQDVPPSNTFYPYVSCLARIGIVQGYPCGGEGEPCGTTGDPYFRPNAYVTRGQIAKIVAESAFFDQQIPPDRQTFEDVPYGSTFWVYIERLAETNLIGGYQCGINPAEPCVPPGDRPYFRPNAGATRGQLTKILSNAAGFDDQIPAAQQTFTDVAPGSTFWLYVERLLANRPGVMEGYPCGGPGEPCDSENRPYFRPNNPLTRGQTSKIVANTFFPDCNMPVVVKIQDFAFWPADITVAAGTTVRFINRDLDPHTATEDANVWDTGYLAQHQFADVVMTTPADYGYYCIPHPFMRGAIHVR
jgi:plastocyanin